MKQPIQSSAVVLALALPLAVQGLAGKSKPANNAGNTAQKGQNNVKGGNTQQTDYQFKNDKFGNGDVLNFNTQNYAQGGNSGARSRKARRSIFARDADGSAHSESSSTISSNGNGIHIKISHDGGDGGFTIENMSQQSGGDVVFGKDGANNGQDGKDGGSIFARWAEPEAFMDGGKASGGNSNTGGGNHASNSNSVNGAKTGKGGNINMQSASQQKGGNTFGGNGGVNAGNGGGGGGVSAMFPIPFRKRDLYEDDALMELVARFAEAEPEAFMDGGKASGGNSNTNGGNHASNSNSVKGAKTGKGGNINMQSASQQKGGNTMGGNGGANFGNGGAGGSVSAMFPVFRRDLLDNEFDVYRREAFMNGGSAKGGDSKTNGGNYASNSNSVKGANTGKGGNINMQSASQQKGGNTMGGSGGDNFGSGGAGGGFGFSVFRRALGLDDDELAMDLYARYAEPEPFMNGGSAKGGDSKTNGGNHASNSNSVNGAKTGKGGNINMQSMSQQKGGNTFGGSGGANAGSGGAGGGFGFSVFRRGEDFDLDARDLDDLVELVARYAEAEAYAEPEAEAEPEFEWDEYDLY